MAPVTSRSPQGLVASPRPTERYSRHMPKRRGRAPRGVSLAGVVVVLGALAVSASGASARLSAPTSLTGAYQLYCPDPVETPIVLHVRAKAVISPANPALGNQFHVSKFQTDVTFPQGIASALAAMSPITGKVTGTVLFVGAVPARRAVAESFIAIIPTSVPATGFQFWVPARAASLGTFTARANTLAVVEASRFKLTLTVGHGAQAETRILACTAFANATQDFAPAQPWVGTKEPPPSDAITPVIALGR